MQRAYYASSIPAFCAQPPEHILGQITQQNTFDLNLAQRDAWLAQTAILKQALAPYEGKVYFEFSIPRMGRRVDAVVIIGSMILVMEFKVGATRYDAADLDQVMDSFW